MKLPDTKSLRRFVFRAIMLLTVGIVSICFASKELDSAGLCHAIGKINSSVADSNVGNSSVTDPVYVKRIEKKTEAPNSFIINVSNNDDKTNKDGETKADESNKEDANDPLTIKGPIQKIQDPLAELINLKWTDGALSTSFPKSYDGAEGPIDAIREEFGYGDGSSYGSPTYRLGFGDTKLKGFIDRAKNGGKGYRTMITLRELSKPYRQLSISSQERDDFTVIVRSPADAYLLRIRQQSDKQFIVQELKNTEVFSTRVADFDAFMSTHRAFAIERLIPALQAFGVGTLISPYNKQVQEGVLKQLQPLNDEQEQEIARMVQELGSDQFVNREEATDRMRTAFESNSELLFHVFLDSGYPPEVRSRMRTVILDKAQQEDIDMINFLKSSRLTNDVPYLVWLLETDLDAHQRQHVIAKFQSVSHQKITPEMPEWKTWVAAQPFSNTDFAAPETDSEKVDFGALLTEGALGKANKHTTKILRLKLESGSLAIDREHWAKPFGGKSIKELTEELEKEFADRNMPKGWFNQGGRSSVARSGHAQVLYELMCESLRGDSDDFVDQFDAYGESDGWELSFNASKIRTRLNMPNKTRRRRRSKKSKAKSVTDDNKKQEVVKDVKPFHFFIEERAKPYRGMAIDESNDSFSINIVCEPLDVSIQMIQNEQGVLLQDIRGLNVRAMQESNFKILLQKNEAYFKEEVFPLLQHMGVQFAPELAAPLQVKPATVSKGEDAGESRETKSGEDLETEGSDRR